jgi:acyl-CoA thioester hydrolase
LRYGILYYEDTDCGKVVYYANYLRYMERSRTELLRERGIELAHYHEKGLLFTVTEAHIRYKAPARYNDLHDVESTIIEIAGASMLIRTVIRRASDRMLLIEGETKIACVSSSGRPVRIPKEITKRLQYDQGNSH